MEIFRTMTVDQCATINGIRKVFDEETQQCLMPVATIQRQAAVTGQFIDRDPNPPYIYKLCDFV